MATSKKAFQIKTRKPTPTTASKASKPKKEKPASPPKPTQVASETSKQEMRQAKQERKRQAVLKKQSAQLTRSTSIPRPPQRPVATSITPAATATQSPRAWFGMRAARTTDLERVNRNPVRGPLYKYLDNKYAVSMLERGNIRIGSLYEYRTHWNDQVRDVEEGKFTASQHLDYFHGDGPLPGLAGEVLNFAGSKHVIVHNLTVDQYDELPNLNIYCTTEIASREVMREFNCNACVEIVDFVGFQNAVIEELARLGLANKQSATFRCSYDGRQLPYEKRHMTYNMPDGRYGIDGGYWLKKPFYAPQREIRTVFGPADDYQLIGPLVLDIPGILPFIRRKF